MSAHTTPYDEAAWYGMKVPAALSVERPDLDVVYAGRPAFDPTRLLAEDYVGGPLAVRGRAMPLLEGLLQAPPYRLLLHALLAGLEIGSIDVDWPKTPGIPVLAELLPILPRLRPGCDAVPGRTHGTAELRRRFPNPPPVTVLHQNPALDLTFTDWPADCLQAISYTAGLDTAWRLARTEYLVLLAPGMQPQGPGWLRALMTLAGEDGTGLAGITPDALVQHETLVLPFYAVATRYSLMAEMGGIDPRYGCDMAVADLCLRLRQLGLRIAGTPHAAVTGPRRPSPSSADLARLRLTWPAILRADATAALS
ncbi:glycosyltransferase family 2 protein [Acidisphaera sp. L21]|uniref:glycosyltransferase family 2 protein n=1 Tax=Acidisphaera sp. L21 TaxID=1641851 RepID=UPI00131C694A|nr:hypothetical protein [Acidisphaera sp. L21]